MKKYIKFIIIELIAVFVVIGIDQITKLTIYNNVDQNGKIDLIKGVLSFTAVKNTGASFGIFHDKIVLLSVVSAICSIGLIVFLIYTIKHRHALLRISLVLIIGGAIGNLIDRVFLGFVRDFVYFEIIDFAVFNLADSALVVGTILLVIYVIFFYKDKEIANENKTKKEKKI